MGRYRLGEGEREEAQTQLEASVGRAETFENAAHTPLVCLLRFQAQCRVMQKGRRTVRHLNSLGRGPMCRFLNCSPTLESLWDGVQELRLDHLSCALPSVCIRSLRKYKNLS